MNANVNPAVLWAGKWVGAAVFLFVACVVIYAGAVFSTYLLAWIVEAIGVIFF